MKHKYNSIIWFLFLVLFLEVVYKIFVFKNIFNINLLYIILFSIPISIILYIICSLFNKKINYILTLLITFLFCLIFIAQSVYYTFYGSLFSVFSIKNGAVQVMEFYGAILEVMRRIWYVLVILIIPFIIFAIFGKKIFGFNKFTFKKFIIYFIISIVFYGTSIFVVNKKDSGIYSLKRLYYDTHAPLLSAEKLGLLTMTRLDIKRYVFGFEEKAWVNKNGKNDTNVVKKIEYNTINIDFDTLIANEKNSTIKNMHTYFKNVLPSKKNNYTGTFKGKNLIFITAEGFDTIAIDPVLTPTLYKMANNSFVFTNYYQPLFLSTTDGEYMNMNGLIPKEGVWSMKASSKISMPFAIGNMFKKISYLTKAYHDGNYKYYARNKSHPNLGFDFVACGNGLEKRMNCKHWPNSDLDMINATYSDYLNENTLNFATYYMTISGHLNYNFYGNNMASRNKALVKNLPYSDAVKAYISCNIEFDKAMEALIKYLEDSGKIDDTLIVISPDHYPYGLTASQINEVSTFNRNDMFELYHTTLIMYNPKIQKTIINKYSSSIDILPTVYNLFGLNFDSRLLMGRDLLNTDEDGLIILSNRSWMSEKGKYNSITKKFTPTEGVTIEDGYVNKINEIVYQ